MHTDNRTLKAAIENYGCKNSAVNDSAKEILELSGLFNFTIDMYYIPSHDNIADIPSRERSDLDCTLSEKAWKLVESRFGPHTFDLVALDSNCQRDRSGRMLPHFTPWPTPVSQGVNVFVHPFPTGHNVYASPPPPSPPFVLVGPLLRFLHDREFRGSLKLVVPDVRPRKFWWALLQSAGVDSLCLGKKGDPSVLLFPSRGTHGWSQRSLQWDLWAFRCVF